MGIQGLLPFVKNACRPVNITEFAGSSVAIDGHCWLHRAVYSCAEKLARGQNTTQYVSFYLKMIELLKKHNIRPIIVFDGHPLPAKQGIHKQRSARRQLMRQKGEKYEMEGNHKEARQCLMQSYDITPSMVLEVIKACRSLGVDCLVSPFEADAQLTYLLNEGYVHFVITEDSDLIPFGCKRILFKMDPNGNGLFYERYNLHKCLSGRAKLLLSPGRNSDEMLFTRFRYACILTGCDYYPGGFNGVGLYKASKAVMSCTNIISIDRMLSRLPQYLNNMHLVVTSEFKASFVRANYTFLYQIVFDPVHRKLVSLHPLPADLDSRKLPFAGHGALTDTVALKIAIGAIPVGHNKDEEKWEFSQISPSPIDLEPHAANGIWSKHYRRPVPFKSPAKTPLIKRRSTLGQVVVFDEHPVVHSTSSSSPSEGIKLSSLKSNPFMLSCGGNVKEKDNCKRKLMIRGNEDDGFSSPQPSKKRFVSHSVMPRKCAPVLKERPKTTAKMQLQRQGSVVQSRYFGICDDDCVIEDDSFVDNAVTHSSSKSEPRQPINITAEAHCVEQEDDVVVIPQLSTGKVPARSEKCAGGADLKVTALLYSERSTQKECSTSKKFSFAHLAYKTPTFSG